MKHFLVFALTVIATQAAWYLLISFWVWSFAWPILFAEMTIGNRMGVTLLWFTITVVTSVLPAAFVADYVSR